VRLPTAQTTLKVSLWAVGLMWLLPFLLPFKRMPVPSFHAEAAAAALGLLAMTALVAFGTRLPIPRVAWLPLGFAGLIVLQILLGLLGYHQLGLLGALFLLWAFGLVLLGGLMRREFGLERVAGALAWFLLAGALASAIIGLAQVLDSYAFLGEWVTPPSRDRVWANLAQPNHLADYLAMGLISAGYLWATRRLRPAYLLGALVFIGYILALTGSRTPWLYLGTVLVVSVGFWLAERTEVNRRLALYSAFALVVLAVVPPLLDAVISLQGGSSSAALQRMRGEVELYEERPRLWRIAWLVFQQAPVLGVGFRQIALQYFFVNADLQPPWAIGFTDHAHNLVLQILAEFGLVGLALLLAAVIPWLIGLFRQPRTPALWWLMLLMAVLTIHSMLEYPLWYTFFLGIAAFLLGLGEPRTLEFARGQRPRVRFALAGFLLLGWLVFAQIFRDYVVLENFLAFRYRYLHADEALNKRAKEMLLEVHRNSLLAPWVELGLARTIHVSPDRLADKLKVNGRAMRAFPIDDVAYRQAMLLALAGQLEAADAQWDRAAVSFPEFKREALAVLGRRVEDGLTGLRPLLEHAQRQP
jgi:O-antigen ligase